MRMFLKLMGMLGITLSGFRLSVTTGGYVKPIGWSSGLGRGRYTNSITSQGSVPSDVYTFQNQGEAAAFGKSVGDSMSVQQMNDYGNTYAKGVDAGNTNTGIGLDGLKTGLAGVQAAAGLMNAYTGYKGLGLAKDQFAFQKSAANRDVANQASLINESRMNAGNVGLALAGNTMNDAQRTAARNKISAGNVDGSAIG
jgi:hypothetical protein